MKIKNEEEVQTWLFEHAQIQGHVCDGVKWYVDEEFVNVAYIDRNTGERIIVEYTSD